MSASKKDQIAKHLSDARELVGDLPDELATADRERIVAGINQAEAALVSVFPGEPVVRHRGPEDEPDAESKVGARRAARSKSSAAKK